MPDWLAELASFAAEAMTSFFTAALYLHVAKSPVDDREARLGKRVLAGTLVVTLVQHLIMFRATAEIPFLTFTHLCFGFAPATTVVIFCLARYRDTWLSAALSSRYVLVVGEASYSSTCCSFSPSGRCTRSSSASIRTTGTTRG